MKSGNSSKTKVATTEKPEKTSNRGKVSSDFPKHTLAEAIAVPQALEEKNGGQPLPPVDMAIALGRSPAASQFKIILSSSIRYGLTAGSYNGQEISLEPLGQEIVRLTSSEERQVALVKSALTPPTFADIFDYYKGKKVPDSTFFENAVIRQFGIPREHAKLCVEIFISNMEYLGLVKNTTSGKWFASDPRQARSTKTEFEDLSDGGESTNGNGANLEAADAVIETLQRQSGRPAEPPKNAIFLGHGKNRVPLEQLEKI